MLHASPLNHGLSGRAGGPVVVVSQLQSLLPRHRAATYLWQSLISLTQTRSFCTARKTVYTAGRPGWFEAWHNSLGQ